jgi:hypothetical protein
MTTGRNNTSVVIRYVYDQSGALPAAAANTAPASTPAAAPNLTSAVESEFSAFFADKSYRFN